MRLLVFLSEYGEVDVALRMLTKVNEERVGASHSRVHVVIHGRIVHQLAECSLVAVKAVCEKLHVSDGLVHLLLCCRKVKVGEVGCEAVGVVQHAVSLSHHRRHALVECLHKCVELC